MFKKLLLLLHKHLGTIIFNNFRFFGFFFNFNFDFLVTSKLKTSSLSAVTQTIFFYIEFTVKISSKSIT